MKQLLNAFEHTIGKIGTIIIFSATLFWIVTVIIAMIK